MYFSFSLSAEFDLKKLSHIAILHWVTGIFSAHHSMFQLTKVSNKPKYTTYYK